MPSCKIDWFRGWQRHAAEGCDECLERLRDYWRRAKRDSRIRARGAPRRARSYDPEFKREVAAVAAARGAAVAAAEFGVPQRYVYTCTKFAGVKAKRPGAAKR